MTSYDINPEQLPARDYRLAMLDRLMELQKEDPNSTMRLVERIWKNLSPEEQETRYIMTTWLFPDDNDKGREKLLSAQILVDHITNEAQLAHELDQEFESIAATKPGKIS